MQGVHRDRQLTVDQFEPGQSAPGTLLLGAMLLGSVTQPKAVEILPDALMGSARVRTVIRNPSNGYMSLVGKARVSPLERLFSYGQAQTGIDRIDQQFAVESNPTEFAANVLEPKDLQQKILEVAEVRPLSIVVRKADLNFQVESLELSNESILSIVEIACDIADAVENAG